MPLPDWTEIFRRNPAINPPGYDECVSQVREGPKRERKRNRAKGRQAHFTGLKHTNPDP